MDDLVAAGREMRERAVRLVDSLDSTQRRRALLRFEDDQRVRWTYLPGRRAGLALRDMDGDQRRLAVRLLRSALSLPALAQAVTVTAWESVLEVVEGHDDGRDPGAYAVCVFDEPAPDTRWAWRFEGHHLCVTVTLHHDRPVTATPLFLGANPAAVALDGADVLRVLGREEQLGRQLAESLSGRARDAGRPSGRPPDDILSRTEVDADVEPEGCAASDLDSAQRRLLEWLLRVYTGRLRAPLDALLFGDAMSDDTLRFLWLGSTAPGEPHYYRLAGRRLLVEYDNTQDSANHVHTVVRDRTGDLGVDPLRHHRAAAHPG